MLADIQMWQLPVVALEFLIVFGAIACAIYYFVKWTGKK
jgi:hypothetical protein